MKRLSKKTLHRQPRCLRRTGKPGFLLLAAIALGGLFLLQVVNWVSALTATSVVPATGPASGGNLVTITGSGFEPNTLTMQNFGQSKCSTMAVYDGQNIGALLSLVDTRNGRSYTVGRLADGNCWMLDNLKIANYNATSTDTDLNTLTSFTIPALDTTNTTNLNVPYVYGTVPGDTGTGATNYGYLYNWPAATAGETTTSITTGNASNSICPKNWRLPRGGEYNDPSSEFSQLNAKMAGFANNQDATYQSNFASYFSNWQYTGAFRGVFSGYNNSGFGDQGSEAYLWSSTIQTGNQVYFTYLTSYFIVPNNQDQRSVGFAVRCLASAATTDSNHYDPKPYVMVDGVAVDSDDIELLSDTSLEIKMPPHAAGLVDITITLGGVTQTVQYEYLDDASVPGVPDAGGKTVSSSSTIGYSLLAIVLLLSALYWASVWTITNPTR